MNIEISRIRFMAAALRDARGLMQHPGMSPDAQGTALGHVLFCLEHLEQALAEAEPGPGTRFLAGMAELDQQRWHR